MQDPITGLFTAVKTGKRRLKTHNWKTILGYPVSEGAKFMGPSKKSSLSSSPNEQNKYTRNLIILVLGSFLR